jgi:hypothetical protein
MGSVFSSEPQAPPPPNPVTQEEIDSFIRVNTAATGGPEVWNMFNAIAFLLLVTLVIFGIMGGLQQLYDYKTVVNNWKQYRCQPLIMPLASFYGHDTADNFQFCLKGIFSVHAEELLAPFTSVLGMFSQILTTIKGTITSVYESIATMGGGIFVIFQDFTDRIMNFFFQLRLSAIRIKNMIYRMQAIMYSMLYMGISGIKATSNFGNTALFSFLDTFCFPPETRVEVNGKGLVPLYQVQIGDVLNPTGSRVTAKFHFAAQGQPMVELKEGIRVSTNHYMEHKNTWIHAADHPDAKPLGPYDRQSLICLDTDDHKIPMGPYTFCDYDETAEADAKTMEFIESRVNGPSSQASSQTQERQTLTEANPSLHPETLVKLENGSLVKARELTVGQRLSTGDTITGILHKEVTEVCEIGKGEIVGSATLVWKNGTWQRVGYYTPLLHYETPVVFIGLIVLTGSQIELASGTRIRDFLELCSPDAEQYYSEALGVSMTEGLSYTRVGDHECS